MNDRRRRDSKCNYNGGQRGVWIRRSRLRVTFWCARAEPDDERVLFSFVRQECEDHLLLADTLLWVVLKTAPNWLEVF